MPTSATSNKIDSASWSSDRQKYIRAIESALENLPVGVALMQVDGRPIFLNATFRKMYGVDPNFREVDPTFEELLKQGRFDDWKQDPAEFFKRMMIALREGRDFEDELQIGDKIFSVHDTMIEGELVLSTQEDITQRVHAERRVTHLANHDPLTDLPNRTAFAEKLASVLEEARARRQKFAILSADLDRFKDVNDVFGHARGDALLREVATRFRAAAGGDFLARLGGDEFTFISLDNNQPQAAASLASRLMESISGDIECAGQTLMASLSIGLAIFPDDGLDAATLLNNADAALYRAKSDGRGVIRSFTPETDKHMREQRALQQDLRRALANNELLLHYQPQSNIDGVVTGFEALLRWQHPEFGMLMPGSFVGLAEESGLIVDIGDWVLGEACREAVSWRKPLNISVNLSPVQFRHGDLATKVHATLLETGLSADRLEVEITESVLIDNFSRAIGLLRRIKALGVHVVMDDFGTGYSSLSYLQAFPFDMMKIDRSFIARLGADGHSDEIVRAVLGLGRGLKLPVVAEGVETAEQLSFLASEHCESVQGYLIGRPGPIADYADIIGESRPLAARHGERRNRRLRA